MAITTKNGVLEIVLGDKDVVFDSSVDLGGELRIYLAPRSVKSRAEIPPICDLDLKARIVVQSAEAADKMIRALQEAKLSFIMPPIIAA